MVATLTDETYRLAFPSILDLENPAYVSYGLPQHELCAHHVENTFNAKCAYNSASGSLTKNTTEVTKLITATSPRFAGMYIGMASHTPWDQVAAATRDALDKKADCVVRAVSV